jgi:ATP synthase protein I
LRSAYFAARKKKVAGRGEAGMLMFRAVFLQFAATLVVAAIAGILAGRHGAVSATLGGAAIVLPNALFALRLFAGSQKPGGASAAAFFVGEFMKVAASIALLALAASLYRDLHWLSLIAGLVVAVKANLFALLYKKF